MDATRCPTRPQGRAETWLGTTQRTGVTLPIVPCLLQTNSDHKRANGPMKSKSSLENRTLFAQSEQTGSKLRTNYTMHTHGTIAPKSREFETRNTHHTSTLQG